MEEDMTMPEGSNDSEMASKNTCEHCGGENCECEDKHSEGEKSGMGDMPEMGAA